MVQEADNIDAFDYNSIEDWQKETPGKIIDATIKLRSGTVHEKRNYLTILVKRLIKASLEKVSQEQVVQEKYEHYCKEKQEMLARIREDAYFLPEDKNQELIIIDFTKHTRQPHIIKNLAMLIYPQALGIIEIKNRFHRDVKTNNLSVSMSLSINSPKDHQKDVGEIMRILNIGDGHPGASAGSMDCISKEKMLRQKKDLLQNIFRLWSEQ